MAVRIKWGSSIKVKDLLKAAKQVERLTGLKVIVDEESDPQIDAGMSKINAALHGKQQLTSDLVYRLQDIVDEIQPAVDDVLNAPVVTILVLPVFGLPISTIVQLAVGEARFKMYILFTMPEIIEQVKLASRTCQDCFFSNSEGKGLEYSNYIAVFLTHEVTHMLADVNDHRGECEVCYLHRDDYRPLRLGACEECIRTRSNQVHKNCLMSYACQQCIASRLDNSKSKEDFLCKECLSKLIPQAAYIARYFHRINESVYLDLMQKHLIERQDSLMKSLKSR